MNNIVFGKYIPIDSIMHRIDPRAKLIALLVMIFAIFIPTNWCAYGVIGLILLIGLFMSKIGIKMIIQSAKTMIIMIIFLLLINSVTVKTGDVLINIGTFTIYSDAIFNTLFVVSRLLLMIVVTTLLTATTKPLDMTLGIEWLLKPFELVHLPTHAIAMMVSIALRFIPTIIEETIRIMNAQKSRGVDFEHGNLLNKARSILSLVVPLFSVAFERAYELADAMEARGFEPGAKRSRYHVLKFTIKDYVFIFISLVILVMSILSRIYL